MTKTEKGEQKPEEEIPQQEQMPDEPAISPEEAKAQADGLEKMKVESAQQDAEELDKTKKELSEAFDDGEEKFKPAQELKGEKLEEMVDWLKGEVESKVDDSSSYMMDYNFEDLVKNLAGYLAEKAGKPIDKVDVKTRTHTANEQISGSLYLGGKEILTFSMGDDGYGPRVEGWDNRNLKEAIGDLLK
jgi:DNA-binding transcriptional MocR family regulator